MMCSELKRKRDFSPYRVFVALTFVLVVLSFYPSPSNAGWEGGITVSDRGVEGFYFAISDYFKVPEREVRGLKKSRVPDDEIPVVFFLSQRAGVSFSDVLAMRLDSMGWFAITLRLGLSPDIFYVPVGQVQGPPYGRAYGHHKNKSKKKRKPLNLTDTEVVDLVNLVFISEYYSHSPEQVIDMRSRGMNFIAISDAVGKKGGKGFFANDNKGGKGNKGKGNKGRGRKK